MIRTSETSHELASHTFSHALFEHQSPESLVWGLQKSREIHERNGLDRPTSLVPPRHQRPDHELLLEHDINAVRLVRAKDESPASNEFESSSGS